MYQVLIGLISKTLTSGQLRTLSHLLLAQSVDPDLGVERGWNCPTLFTTRSPVLVVGTFENLSSFFGNQLRVSLVNISWGHERST
ncbi:hypothetical protein FEAC_24160 [Ferrimicrobium acidiphilum DSM 19497]|jgi:hypothetical protein|uniref:Uncharacterized protein n=1 Tax=Ferrimicrobium acidiphilum DSM 19497 TaxID=1121877 RepID=A0A0D8FRV6_9ACTN|nr:hypothetical protein FEAC_24160 [Ferrimicrobium acidiphilum DSM 19497]